ncbi:MAG: MHS family MFS transporter [Deltaproteobacteria bacterium]|nr:MHS family MFS transporter [Deltaproteobacteria bacterium]
MSAQEQSIDSSTLRRVIFASSLGTLFEWYDFYLYGTLAVFFGSKFFPPGNPTTQLLASLATFGAGFGVRPLGALVFGHIGDLIGRKYTFLVTMATMGLSTALVGFLPTYDQIGVSATIILVALRLLQGLALGGEYGGAATYVAEHVPDARRGYYTAFIQTTATLGFFVSMIVIGVTRKSFGEDAFKAGGGALGGIAGWRIPFLMSFLLLAVSFYIRLKMQESPLFSKLKVEKKVSVNPLKESFTNKVNLRFVLLALFGATAGQGVVWYTGQFYALSFLQASLKLDWFPAYVILSCALALGTPFFLVFGSLSDRIGRKKVMLTGCALAAITYVPIYMAMKAVANPSGATKILWENLSAGTLVIMVLLVFVQLIYVTMVYGPIAAFLVELFPTNIRYTSMSLPYHLGNGWFGGFLPLIATAVAASATAKEAFGSGSIYAGLIYPIVVALITLVVGGLFIKETKDHKIDTLVSAESTGERFDWMTVMTTWAIGYVLLAVASKFVPMVAGFGFAMGGVGDFLFNLIPAFGLAFVPAIFFRLTFPNSKSIGLVIGCLVVMVAIGAGLHPALKNMGGGMKFFADPIMLVVYVAILLGAYTAMKPKGAAA